MITIKTPQEIEIMRKSGSILAAALEATKSEAKVGVSTIQLDAFAEHFIRSHGGEPAFKGYERFPYSLCVSINENIVHGLPSEYVLQEGDVVKLDLGVRYEGYNTDMAVSVIVGKGSKDAERLLKATKHSMLAGIEKAKMGNTTGDIGAAVFSVIDKEGFAVVRELCGHGIGKHIHEDPQVLNYGQPGKGDVLKEGMVICIEPMVILGSRELAKSADGYGYRSRDNSLTAHFEHTIAITAKGPEILTKI